MYALGDVAKGDRNVAKAGIFAASAARVVAADIAANIHRIEPPPPYQGDGPCYAFCVNMLGNRAEAEDALQLTFVSAYSRLRRDQEPVVLRPWLYRIARSHCLPDSGI